jgi:hypothetical protein
MNRPINPNVAQIFGAGPLHSFYSSIFSAVLAFSNPHIEGAMLRLEKSARGPENTALKAPASKNLYNARVNPHFSPGEPAQPGID